MPRIFDFDLERLGILVGRLSDRKRERQNIINVSTTERGVVFVFYHITQTPLVDGYLQWCTIFVRTAQGTNGALAQSLICFCLTTPKPDSLLFSTHRIIIVPMETTRCLFGLPVC